MVILISQIVILILGMNRAGGLDQVWRHISSSGLLSEIMYAKIGYFTENWIFYRIY